MAVIYELYDSRSVTVSVANPSVELKYIITGVPDEDDADTLLIATAPTSYLSLSLLERRLDPQGGGVWYATVRYGPLQSAPLDGQGDPAQPPETTPPTPTESQALTFEYSFDTTGATQHITQSLLTRERKARTDQVGIVAPDYGGAVGVSKDAVAGTEIIVPKFEFQITKTVLFVTLGYLKTLRDLTGRTNDRRMWHWEAGELLFLGATGSGKGGEVGWLITYKFLTAKNRAQVVIVPGDDNDPPILPPILALNDVKGFDFIDVTYEDAVDEGFGIQRPKFAYCHRVYESGDFTRLGLGGA